MSVLVKFLSENKLCVKRNCVKVGLPNNSHMTV